MSEDTTTTCASVPHWEAYGYLRNISGVIVGEHGHVELRQALQGAAAVTALFMQRELDTEQGTENPLTFHLALRSACCLHWRAASTMPPTLPTRAASMAYTLHMARLPIVLEKAAQEIRFSRAGAD